MKQKFNQKINHSIQHENIILSGIDFYELSEEAELLLEMDGYPVVWKMGNAYFITGTPANDNHDFYEYWLELIGS